MDYFSHLQKDKKLLPALTEKIELQGSDSRLEIALISSIISQQLSTKVASVIKQRFYSVFGGREPALEEIVAVSPQQLRSIGLSKAKAAYVHNVATFFLGKAITRSEIESMDNESIIKLLTEIKGVGRWTVEMILMFTLGRKDVFAADDLNIQQTMIH